MNTDFLESDNDEFEEITINHGDTDYELYLDSRLVNVSSDECLEILLKAYADLGFCNPVYAILTKGIGGPIAVGIEP